VAKAKPDGYTIVVTVSSLAIGPSLYKKLNYDPVRDFAPISLVAQTPNILFVHPSVPVDSLKELVDLAKANPGKLNYGSPGTGLGPQLAVELLKSLAKINIVHVPYKGGGLALVALMGGEVDMQVMTYGVASPGIAARKVKPLAVLGNKRALSLPNVPTAKEAGIDNFEVLAWFGIHAPAGTPRDIINRLNAEWTKIAAMPDNMAKMRSAGELEAVSNTPEQFSEFIKVEIARWAEVIKEARISRID
jgi:tripartite-type tricarboxylate transporter receptor subunit TctC